MRINYPNNSIDTALVFGYLIAINLTQPPVCFILAIVLYILRIVVAIYVPCYQSKLNNEHLFFVISSLIFAIGVILAHFSGEYTILLGFSLLMMFLMWKIMQIFRDRHQPYSVRKKEGQEIDIDDLKRNLWKDGLFTYVYRQLIFMDKKSTNFRQDLSIEILK